LPDGNAFCNNCGARIEIPPQATAEQPFEVEQNWANNPPIEPVQIDYDSTTVLTPDQSPFPTGNRNQAYNPAPDPAPAPAPAYDPAPAPAYDPAAMNGYNYYPQAPVETKKKKAKKVKQGGRKGGKKTAIIIIISLLVVAALGVGAFFVMKNLPKDKKSKAPFAYVSGDSLYVMKNLTEKEEPVCITKDYSGDSIFSENGKYVLYGQSNSKSNDSYEFDLYYKEIFNEKDEGTLVAKNVSDFSAVESDLSKIVYLKNDKLYYGDTLGEFDKIASDVYLREYNSDVKKAVCYHYYSDDKDYDDDYSYEGSGYYEVGIIDFSKSSPEYKKLISSCNSFDYTKDLSCFYYTDDDNLYKMKADGDKEKISASGEDVNSFFATSKGVYYITDGENITYYDFVDDPYVEADKKIQKPNYDDYKVDSEDFYVTEEDEYGEYEYFDREAYWDAQDKADEKYEKAYDEYEKAQERWEIRENLEDETLTYCEKIYYFDGSKSTLLFDNANSFFMVSVVGEDNGDRAFRASVFAKPVSEMKKISIDDADYYTDVSDAFYKQVEYDNYVIFDGVSVDLKVDDDISQMYYNTESDEIYLFTYDADAKTKEYDFYTLKAGKPFSEATLVEKDCEGFVMINGKPNYYDSYDKDDYTYTVYIDNEQKIEAGERVAQGVFCKYGSCGDIPDAVRQGGTGSTGTK
jgi:hypothetical protein